MTSNRCGKIVGVGMLGGLFLGHLSLTLLDNSREALELAQAVIIVAWLTVALLVSIEERR